MSVHASRFSPASITRPHPRLMTYYLLSSLLVGPLFPIAVIPLAIRYNTLRYKFDDSGISVSWGVIFRREVHLTYRRIQDIHLTRNILQRWMGLASVAIQTASGSATPEVTIEGVLEVDALRDYLYSHMRGARGETEGEDASTSTASTPGVPGERDEALALLHEIRDLIRGLDKGRRP